MTYHLICNRSNTTGGTSGVGTAYPSETPEVNPVFQWNQSYSIFTFLCTLCIVLLIIVCPFSFCQLYCLSFDIRLMITPLLSSNLFQGSSFPKIFILFIKTNKRGLLLIMMDNLTDIQHDVRLVQEQNRTPYNVYCKSNLHVKNESIKCYFQMNKEWFMLVISPALYNCSQQQKKVYSSREVYHNKCLFLFQQNTLLNTF